MNELEISPCGPAADACKAYLGCSSSIKGVLGLGRERTGRPIIIHYFPATDAFASMRLEMSALKEYTKVLTSDR